MVMIQIFIKTKGKEPIINPYVAEIILPMVLITLSFTTEDINMEITTNVEPK